MHIQELLEKRERAIDQLVTYLRNRKEVATLKEVGCALQLSRTTLMRYIQSFAEQAQADNLPIQLCIKEEEIHYERASHFTQEEWLSYLCKGSLKYDILMYIFEKEEFTIQGLSQHLLISEATLNRQLASLNQDLKAFDISIRNGQLKGSELQIRYFYYQLFWAIIPTQQLEEEFIFQQAKQQLPLFERFYDVTFNQRQARQIILWLSVLYRRMRLKFLDFEPLYQLMLPYTEHKFYQRLRKMILTANQYRAFTFHEGEIMSLFVFLLSQFILKPNQMEQVLGFGGPIMEATTWAFQQIRQEIGEGMGVDEEGLYHLNQVLSQVYFFKGSIRYGNICYERHAFYKESETILTTVCQRFYDEKASFMPQRKDSIEDLVQLFSYFLQKKPLYIRIGFASCRHQVVSTPILLTLQQRLEKNRFVVIDWYQEGEEYDFIISDDYHLSGKNIYYLHHQLMEQDVLTLKEMIETLYQEKEKQAEKRVMQPSFEMERR